jgi:hypothetical protein
MSKLTLSKSYDSQVSIMRGASILQGSVSQVISKTLPLPRITLPEKSNESLKSKFSKLQDDFSKLLSKQEGLQNSTLTLTIKSQLIKSLSDINSAPLRTIR